MLESKEGTILFCSTCLRFPDGHIWTEFSQNLEGKGETTMKLIFLYHWILFVDYRWILNTLKMKKLGHDFMYCLKCMYCTQHCIVAAGLLCLSHHWIELYYKGSEIMQAWCLGFPIMWILSVCLICLCLDHLLYNNTCQKITCWLRKQDRDAGLHQRI